MHKKYRIRIFRNMIISVVIFISGSCLEYTVNTSVNKDGSITREYTVKGDSSDIFDGSLMIPAGKDWKVTGRFEDNDKQEKTSDKQYVYQASKKFRNAREFNEWLASDTSEQTIKIKVNLQKRFRWFYTYYKYNEMYPMSYPFKKLPVDSFLTELEQLVIMEDDRIVYSPPEKGMIWKKDTLGYLYNHSDSVEIKKINDQCEERFLQWMIASILVEFNDLLIKNFDDPSLPEITAALAPTNKTLMDKITRSFKNDSINAKVLVEIGDSVAQTNILHILYTQNTDVFGLLDQQIKDIDSINYTDGYEHHLVMPGQVYSTNAFRHDGNLLIWKFEPLRYYMKDFKMKAESRLVNHWVMVISAIIMLLLFWFLVRGLINYPKRQTFSFLRHP